MTAVPFFEFTPPGAFLVSLHWTSRRFAEPSDVLECVWRAWEVLGGGGSGVGLWVGRPPRRLPGSYGHVFVGTDLLGWYTDPVTGQSPAGAAGHVLTYPPTDPWAVRGAWVDDRHFQTARDMGATVAHEVEHLLGLTHEDQAGPDRLAKVRAGAARAAAWAEVLHRTGEVPV